MILAHMFFQDLIGSESLPRRLCQSLGHDNVLLPRRLEDLNVKETQRLIVAEPVTFAFPFAFLRF